MSTYFADFSSSSPPRDSVRANPFTVASGVRRSWHASETSRAKVVSLFKLPPGTVRTLPGHERDAPLTRRSAGIAAGRADRPLARGRDRRREGDPPPPEAD